MVRGQKVRRPILLSVVDKPSRARPYPVQLVDPDRTDFVAPRVALRTDDIDVARFRVPRLGAEVFVHHAGQGAVKGHKAKGVRDTDVLSLEGFEVEVYTTEGHTQDSCCYRIGEALFTGDTLFNGSVGGTGSRELFCQETDNIRAKIFKLPDGTAVFPGHGPPTTVGIERVCNPFF